MICALVGLILLSSGPDTSLRLKIGDDWTTETTYTWRLKDDTVCNVESQHYSVVREKGKAWLIAETKLKETKLEDGNVVPAPRGTLPLVLKLALDGQDASVIEGDDVPRHRIERFLAVERKGLISEPSWFPPPPTVRLFGIKKTYGVDPRLKDENTLVYAGAENSADHPMRGSGTLVFDPKSGILTKGLWQIENAPMPGGQGYWELEVVLELKTLKLAPRT